MTIELQAGARLRSTVCDTEVAVIKAPVGAVDLRCGGAPMALLADDAAERGAIEPGFADGTAIGKRYSDDEASIELLCTKSGEGSLSIGEAALGLKGAKPLPSSD
ncbi:hypothetical protein [Aquihabitans sp. McL0605]|uniref:hypothetical protein n=1 Tax=Aquihabitans sp. McL0605 TaxID=3415671 RepID=UPI003CED5D3E